ncbi:MAG: restriction endonuclease subunit S [Promethearchaeota archaeon]
MSNKTSTQQYKKMEIKLSPSKWKLYKLKEITERTEQIDFRKLPRSQIKYIDVSSISNETFRIESIKELDSKEAPRRARKVIREGDVLFATVRPSLRRVALVPATLDGQVCSTAICVIRCNLTVALPQFVYYTVTSNRFIQQVTRRERGTNYPAVTDRDVLNQPIFLPPLKEQQYIATILSIIQNSIYRCIEVIQETKLLKKSLMKYLFIYGAVPYIETGNIALKECEFGRVPSEWSVLPFRMCIVKNHNKIKTVKQGLYQKEGVFPIIDQSKDAIGGYWDQEEDLWQTPLPVIIFGDHTREIKYVDFPFVCGAQGVKVIQPNTALFEPKFLYYALLNLKIPNRGYNRHFSLLKNSWLPYPPLKEQKKIICVLSAIDKKLKAELNKKHALNSFLNTFLQELPYGKKIISNG